MWGCRLYSLSKAFGRPSIAQRVVWQSWRRYNVRGLYTLYGLLRGPGGACLRYSCCPFIPTGVGVYSCTRLFWPDDGEAPITPGAGMEF
jgi:hypothetical protein